MTSQQSERFNRVALDYGTQLISQLDDSFARMARKSQPNRSLQVKSGRRPSTRLCSPASTKRTSSVPASAKTAASSTRSSGNTGSARCAALSRPGSSRSTLWRQTRRASTSSARFLYNPHRWRLLRPLLTVWIRRPRRKLINADRSGRVRSSGHTGRQTVLRPSHRAGHPATPAGGLYLTAATPAAMPPTLLPGRLSRSPGCRHGSGSGSCGPAARPFRSCAARRATEGSWRRGRRYVVGGVTWPRAPAPRAPALPARPALPGQLPEVGAATQRSRRRRRYWRRREAVRRGRAPPATSGRNVLAGEKPRRGRRRGQRPGREGRAGRGCRPAPRR